MLKHPLVRTKEIQPPVADSIVNPIDLTKIKAKLDSYTSFNEFHADIEWMLHNCVILYSGRDCDWMCLHFINFLEIISDSNQMFMSLKNERFFYLLKHAVFWILISIFHFRETRKNDNRSNFVGIRWMWNCVHQKVCWVLFKSFQIPTKLVYNVVHKAASHYLGKDRRFWLLAGKGAKNHTLT